ncbi:ABC transporter ATP-binding protein [Halomonas denitrificans]|nr:ABC transporter ATP-binding protein [Halomonas denitrificans]
MLSLRGLARGFHDGRRRVPVLDGVDLELARRQAIAIMGASGSGKSTLLHLAAGMDVPDAGEVRLAGRSIHALAEPERTRERARSVGLVFQDFNLVDSLSVRENIELALWLSRAPGDPDRIDRLTRALAIAELLDRRPNQLSGGQQQRVAIARALVHGPALVLADEPTGSLDRSAGDRVMDVLVGAVRSENCALIVVTHSASAASRCDRTLDLRDGRLVARDS